MDESADISALVTRLRDALLPVAAVRVAYVFGSRARGTARKESDLDIAVLFARGLDVAARHDAYLDVIARAEDAFGAAVRIDVVDLQEADSAVAFRAITQGRLVLARTHEERLRTEVTVARRYEDDGPKRRLFLDAARRVAAEWAKSG
jgi:predicted nucleotidyltransferase